MKRLFFSAIAVMFAFGANAQDKKERDQKSIKSMCGCYEVGFNFAETFSYSKDENYKPSKTKHESALEWIELLEDSDDKIVMQHLLIAGNPAQPHIVKHWRQDWLYENTDFYMYNGDNKWNFVKKDKNDVKGQWTQKVFQVDDSPRYEGSATWVYVDGKTYWENTTDAPLPRREHTTRNDYNVTVRTNRHEITKEGWIHDENNDKIIRKRGKKDELLAQEKGYNTYVKVDDSKCKAAQDWWKENNSTWKIVRTNWKEVLEKNKNLELKSDVDNKKLFEHLFALKPNASEKEIQKIIKDFVK